MQAGRGRGCGESIYVEEELGTTVPTETMFKKLVADPLQWIQQDGVATTTDDAGLGNHSASNRFNHVLAGHRYSKIRGPEKLAEENLSRIPYLAAVFQ
ncbi:hypothetical protein M569_12194 [Genlisea aurea]|uniref:Uncharacterized protein n=1 Tax=Genlisea aurea TaxID=192259 RepID=S8CDN3_9LAMI|nr:hypothetical protein M569_12194 [Genlisea aurea]